MVNLGQIIAQGGKVGIYGGLIKQAGVVNANTAVRGENGKIVFKATKDVTLEADDYRKRSDRWHDFYSI